MRLSPSLLSISSDWLNANSTLVTIISIIVTIVATLVAVFRITVTIPRNRRWRKEYLDILDKNYNVYTENNIYIQPFVSFTPQEEKTETDSVQHFYLKKYFLNRVFVKKPNAPRVHCLLGDTGTGKTAALVHLFIDYINSHTQKNLPYDIKLFSLRRENVFDEINQIPNPEKCILLLDAIDECPIAQSPDGKKELIQLLEKAYNRFAIVVTTCRLQFFPDKKSEFDTTNIPVEYGDFWLHCQKLYLEPFNDRQIQAYLDEVFTFRSDNPLRQKAEKIVSEHALIAIRPLVLTYIRKLVESGEEIHSALDFYDLIVDDWIKRDILKASNDNPDATARQWWDMTSEVAGYLYEHKKLTLSHDEFLSILSAHNLANNDNPINETLFQHRSLITRTADLFQFTHTSFYEYFIAYRYLLSPDEITSLEGMKLAQQLNADLLIDFETKVVPRFPIFDQKQKEEAADFLVKLAKKLYEIKQYSRAETFYRQALSLFQQLAAEPPDTPLQKVADTQYRLGDLLCDIHQYSEAETELKEALALYRQLDNNASGTYQSDIAKKLHTLAWVHSESNHHDVAEKEYLEALAIRRELAEKDPDTYLSYVAQTLNNLGNLHHVTQQFKAAEKEHQEALAIRQGLAKKDPDKYKEDVAESFLNLAIIHYVTKQYDVAEDEYKSALAIRRELAAKDPDTYKTNVANTLGNMANLHQDIEKYSLARKEYYEALDIYQSLAQRHPDVFLPEVALTLMNLGILHYRTNQYDVAVGEYMEALRHFRQLAQKSPDAYQPNVAKTLYNMAVLYMNQHNLPAAEAAAQESVTIYRQMAELSHAAFDYYLEDAEARLEEIQQQM